MTQAEALDAIAGRLEVAVFFMDAIHAWRVRRIRKDETSHSFCRPFPDGPELTIDESKAVELKPDRYLIPRFSNGRTQPLVVHALSFRTGLPGPVGLGMLPLFVLDPGDGGLYALCRRTGDVLSPHPKFEFARTFPEGSTLLIEKAPPSRETSSEKLNRERFDMCIEEGLVMPTKPESRLPTGVAKVAEKAGVKRQTFSASVKAHIKKLATRDHK